MIFSPFPEKKCCGGWRGLLLSQLPFDDAVPNALICGRTHKRVIGEVVSGFPCVNVGSDCGMLMYCLLELRQYES